MSVISNFVRYQTNKQMFVCKFVLQFQIVHKMCANLILSKTSLIPFNLLNTVKLLSRNVVYVTNSVNFGAVVFNFVSKKCFHTSCAPILSKAVIETTKDKSKIESSGKPEKKRKEKLTYITLVETDEDVTVTTLEDATKLALRRNLKLIKIKETDMKSERSTYQLMTPAQYLAEEKKSKIKIQNSNSSIKGIKLLSISSKISDHDLQAKINNVTKWLEKRCEVRIVISNDNGEAENVYNKITEKVKDAGRVVQKRFKGMDLRFQVLPPKKLRDDESSGTNSDDSQSKL